jgi:hypothetical protein
MTAFILRGDKIEISCAKGVELRDNNFNIGGHAIWDGIGRMDGRHQFEAEAIAAVSGPEYFALQKLPNRAIYEPPISCYAIRLYNSWAASLANEQRRYKGRAYGDKH